MILSLSLKFRVGYRYTITHKRTKLPPRKDTGKEKATSTAPSKAKATFAPPLKKRKGGKATSSLSGAQVVVAVAAMRPQPQGQWKFGINSISPHTKDWYRRCSPKHVHLEAAIQERSLKAKYQAIWRGMQDLGLSYVFMNTGDINLNLVWEFYAGFDPQDTEQLVPIRGRLIDFSATSICDILGQRVNVGHLIRYQMSSVRTSKKVDRMPFANFLTQFLRHEGVEEEPEFDHTIDQPIRQMDITNLRLKEETAMPSLTGAECNARDDSVMDHLYGMMDLQLRIGGQSATSKERT
ncbi:hypothetical protein A4A49_25241 [Nicotiana attenuata]|uniref:Uncharacterized protein n=1 Tax=Nicotiana attenuata TaxID=49451 RepID=A0A1J6KNU9_NICAT|nr:hypothetical protein A4A49_25241 [Nicotiana attenuata]